jgi:exonuclease III
MNLLRNYKTKIVKCGDININYLENCTKRQQLDPVSATYNSIGTVHFATRITNECISAKGNIFIDKTRNFTTSPFMNGTSDHDAQVITLNNIFLQK